MFANEYRAISNIVENVLGKSRTELDVGAWNEFNCPYCADLDDVKYDNKFNLCLNFEEGFFHCWKCGTAGKISKVLKDYGNSRLVSEYYNELKSIRDSKYYILDDNKLIKSELYNQELFSLPEEYKKIDKQDSDSYRAYKYLIDRGLDDDIIKEFSIGYAPWSDNYKMRNRIIVPSYDDNGMLNYYVTRDYTGKQRLKYINPNIDKKTVIFNELKINWGETIYLVEGVFDHFVVPNSIPLLGKHLDSDCAVYKSLYERSLSDIVIMLDDDALSDEKELFLLLDRGNLRGRVKVIEMPTGYDASSFYQKFGKKGMIQLLRTARFYDEKEIF